MHAAIIHPAHIYLLSTPDLSRTSCSTGLFREDSEGHFSGGDVSIDTSTTEKDFTNFSDNSEGSGILGKSGQVDSFKLSTDEAATSKTLVLDTVTLLTYTYGF